MSNVCKCIPDSQKIVSFNIAHRTTLLYPRYFDILPSYGQAQSRTTTCSTVGVSLTHKKKVPFVPYYSTRNVLGMLGKVCEKGKYRNVLLSMPTSTAGCLVLTPPVGKKEATLFH